MTLALRDKVRRLRKKTEVFLVKHPYWSVFLVSLFIGCLLIVPTMIAGGGVFTFVGDYNMQQIPFNIDMNRTFKEGGATWNWYNDVGVSYVGSYSFYNLFSPFVMILWLFPVSWVPYLMGAMYVLKYAVAGLTAYMFISRYVKTSKWAMLGAIFYAFSGFQIVNMQFYHFHDVVAFFPLLLYGLDKLVLDNKKGVFLVSVVLNLLTNYYFFIGQVMFVVLYYIVMIATGHYKWSWRSFGLIALESVIGVAMGAFVLIPSMIHVMGNPRTGMEWTPLGRFLYESLENYTEILRGLVMPNESMGARAMIANENFKSVEAYLPFVGAVLWLSYLIKKPSDPMSKFLIMMIIFMFVPFLNSAFSAFSAFYYARWFYMPILFMSLLSAKALEEKTGIGTGVIAMLGILLTLALLLLVEFQGGSFVIRGGLLAMIVAVMVVNLLATFVILHYAQDAFWGLLAGAAVYIGLYGNYAIYYCKREDGLSYDWRDCTDMDKAEALVKLDKGVRVATAGCKANLGVLTERMVVNSWNSNDEEVMPWFYWGIGEERDVAVRTGTDNKELQTFLSVKYIVSCLDAEKNELLEELYGVGLEEGGATVFENDEYEPVGKDYKYYVSKDEYLEIEEKDRVVMLNKAVVLTEEQIEKYGDLVKHYENGVERKSKVSENVFTPNRSGFTSEFEAGEERLMVYTVPYTKGWVVTVNGEEVGFEKVDEGMVGIKVGAGHNLVEFRYEMPGQKMGNYVSAVGALSCVGYVILCKRKVIR